MTHHGYKDMFNLSGKTAIVTGGSGILGRCFCSGLAEYGANVVVVDLSECEAERFAQELSRKYGVRTCGMCGDVSSPDSVQILVKKIAADFGDIHILHNNAQEKTEDFIKALAPFEEYALDEWRRV